MGRVRVAARSSARSWELTDEDVRSLGEDAFFVRDDFVDLELARGARAQMEALAEAETLRPAGVGRGAGYRREGHVRGDRIVWLDSRDTSGALAEVHGRFEVLRRQLNEAAYLGLDYFEVQAAMYPGESIGYDRHVDAFAGGVNRRVTAIVYLNEDWTPAHGGELRAWLPDGRIVEVEPRVGRLVCFLSDQIPHQVLPTRCSRFAITAWYRPRTAVI